MRTARVIALNVSALGNKVFNVGQRVTDQNFHVDQFDKLISAGFIREETEDPPRKKNKG